jgi:PAS domain S-box-containing protein
VGALAGLLLEKTGGNPYSIIQFLGELYEERLLSFDTQLHSWQWDIGRITGKGISANLAELLSTKLGRLPSRTQEAIADLACLGNFVRIDVLATVRESSSKEIRAALQDAVGAGLLAPAGDSFTFTHDRVHQASYELISKAQRQLVHLRIGRALLAQTTSSDLEESIFEIVDQFNRGVGALHSQAERVKVAELNLIAGMRAKAASAYSAAHRYFISASDLLSEERWVDHYRCAFNIERQIAECELVAGDLLAAEIRLNALSSRPLNLADEAIVVRIALLLHLTAGTFERAIDLGLAFLRRMGTELPPDPSDAQIHDEYVRMSTHLHGRPIETLIDSPAMTDLKSLVAMEVLVELWPAATIARRSLGEIMLLRMANLSLEHGNCEATCTAYAALNTMLGVRFGDYRTGSSLSLVACDLADRDIVDIRSRARIYSLHATWGLPWVKCLDECQRLQRLALDVQVATGDTVFAAYTLRHLVTNILISGAALPDVQAEAERAMSFAQHAQVGIPPDRFIPQLHLVRSLRGIQSVALSADDRWTVRNVQEDTQLARMMSFHFVYELQERFYAGDYVGAIKAAIAIEPVRWALQSAPEDAEYEFYGALTRAALYDGGTDAERSRHLEVFRMHCRRIEACAEACPETFSSRRSLVLAELSRIEGRVLDAELLFENAIHLSQENFFLQNEGLANEIASRFYRSRGFQKIADVYLRDAMYCYARWGADAKVRQLQQSHSHVTMDQPLLQVANTISVPVDYLDLSKVIEVLQAVSSETILDKLITIVVRISIEQAGANRGVLILPQGSEFRIEAEAMTGSDAVTVVLRSTDVTSENVPESIFNTVIRTGESILLSDARVENSYSGDIYFQKLPPRSVLCLPLVKQARLLGVLYLENTITPNVFTPARLAILNLLASEAAISLENSRLYHALQEREARVRRLIDSNIIGILVWNADSVVLEANEAFLQIIGYERGDLVSNHATLPALTPPEWREANAQRLIEVKQNGRVQPFEQELFRKDGSRVSVLIGAARFDEADQGVAFVLDLSERNFAEQAALASERRYLDMQIQLTQASRDASMSQLSAAIAHEVNQPLAGIVTNASTCLRMLGGEIPNIEGALETLRRTLRDARRASDIVARLRTLFSNGDVTIGLVDINEEIRDVVALQRRNLEKNRVEVMLELTADLLPIDGDRVQLQQVILNLIVNASDAMNGVVDRARVLLIKSWQEVDRTCVAVQDSGLGLTAEGRIKLFDPFYTTKSSGMGIGLSISRSIVEQHKGNLWAEPNESAGATLSFSLPSRAAA